ncbi:MAG TPA: SDR family oxidoreductase [Phycisphaerae bacterium]|nr:SDR family oxidoreductase [Phycisphaerae bacterium]HOJ75118.1 SDR family oxidoreductase [Phycisphaerae bacterium]HOM52348.1 SDR family oxidoreductase [Phycisphaerae bacterium]HON68586.1 SDR family oxidoreductase [Phycisphaerae bacterium]HOQ86701.1 SDR family oxidoreductase [Phycisphaerae bacterium]
MSQENVLITGASSGIGLELAKLFAADGDRLILVARRADKLEALADELRRNYGTQVQVIVADLRRPEAPQEIFDVVQSGGQPVDVLVNNAGFGARGRFVELDPQRQADMIQVNVTAPTRLARLFLPGMLQRNRGGILNVASTAAFQPGPYMSVYYATKAYILSFSEALAEEVRRTNVRISCLAPGPTITEFGDVADMSATKAFRHWVMEAEPVARAGYNAFRRGKALVVPGKLNRVGTLAVRFMPLSLARKVTAWIQQT